MRYYSTRNKDKANGSPPFKHGGYVFIPALADALSAASGASLTSEASLENGMRTFAFALPELTALETGIIKDGCLMNYNTRIYVRKEEK